MINKIAKAGAGYTLANIIIKGINIISLPIFSRMLSTEEFGMYSVYMAYEAIFSCVLSLTLHVSVRRANYEFPEKIHSYVSSILLIYIANTCCTFFLLLFFYKRIFYITTLASSQQFLLVAYSFGSSILALYNQVLSLNYSYKKYMFIVGINSSSSVILSIFLMLTLFGNNRLNGRLVGITIPVFCIALAIVVEIFRREKPEINKQYWLFGLKYSTPIIPHGIAQVLLAQCDRVMIQRMVGAYEAGIYGFSGNIRLILTVITDSLNTVWSTWFFEQMHEHRVNKIVQKAETYIIFFLVITITLMAVSPEMILVLGGYNYLQGRIIVFPMVIDAFFLFLYGIVVQGEYYLKKTKYIFMGTFCATVINLIFNYIFINQYGFIAAAYTTLFSYFCYLILHIIICRKIIGFLIIPIRILVFSLCVVLFWGLVCLRFLDAMAVRWGSMIIFDSILISFLFYKSKKDS